MNSNAQTFVQDMEYETRIYHKDKIIDYTIHDSLEQAMYSIMSNIVACRVYPDEVTGFEVKRISK